MNQLDSWLWFAAGVGAFWALGPAVLRFAGLGRIRFVAEHDPYALEFIATKDPDYARRIARLYELGFKPLGMVTETAWFHFGQWRTAFEVYCLATPDGKCFASLYRLHPGEPVRLGFESFTTNRGMVRTVMPGVGEPQSDEDFSRLEFQGLDEAELLARHHEHVESFLQRTRQRVIPQTLEGRTSTDEEHERRRVDDLAVTVVFLLLFFVAPALGVWWLLGYVAESIPEVGSYALALCGGTLAYFTMVKIVLPLLVRQSCRQDHAQGPRGCTAEAG